MKNVKVFIKIVDGIVEDIEGTEGADIYLLDVDDGFVWEYEATGEYTHKEMNQLLEDELPSIKSYLINYIDINDEFQVKVIKAKSEVDARVGLGNEVGNKLKKIYSILEMKQQI